jgi:ABC-type nitrate/sulfonate/bicarbonate transport system permease component
MDSGAAPGRHPLLTSTTARMWATRAASLTVFLVLWEGFARRADSLLLPTATETGSALLHLLGTGELWAAAWISNQAMIAGYLAALLVGVPLGLAAGRWRAVERPLDAYLNILLVTPVSAMIPIFVMALGLGFEARAAVVFVYAVAMVTVNTRAGIKSVDPAVVEMARAFCGSETQVWRKVLLPGGLPGVMAGARLGLARAISGMAAVELLLISVGFGRLLLGYQADFESGSVYAVVLVVVAEAVLLNAAISAWERRAQQWSRIGEEA